MKTTIYFPHLAFITLFFSSILFACSSTKKAEVTYFANFYARYDGGKLKVEAIFKPLGARVEKESEAIAGTVLFNQQEMKVSDAYGVGKRYLYTAKGKRPEHLTFEIQPERGKSRIYKAELPVLDSFWIEPELSISKGFYLAWKGNKLEQNEQLVLLLTDGSGKTTSMNRVDGSVEAKIEVIPPQLEDVAKGKGSLALVRKQTMDLLEEDKKVGRILMEFYTRTVEVEVVD